MTVRLLLTGYARNRHFRFELYLRLLKDIVG